MLGHLKFSRYSFVSCCLILQLVALKSNISTAKTCVTSEYEYRRGTNAAQVDSKY